MGQRHERNAVQLIEDERREVPTRLRDGRRPSAARDHDLTTFDFRDALRRQWRSPCRRFDSERIPPKCTQFPILRLRQALRFKAQRELEDEEGLSHLDSPQSNGNVAVGRHIETDRTRKRIDTTGVVAVPVGEFCACRSPIIRLRPMMG